MLTPKQFFTYQFIRSHILRHENSPSVREVAEGTGLAKSHGVAHRNIQALVQAGWISQEENKNRSIKLLKDAGVNTSCLPMVGFIAAGEPTIEKARTTNAVLDVTSLLMDQNLKVIKMHDESLQAHNICAGDYLLCHPKLDATQAGDMCVFILSDDSIELGIILEEDESNLKISSSPTKTHLKKDLKFTGKYTGIIRMANA